MASRKTDKTRGITVLSVLAQDYRRLHVAEVEMLPEAGLIRVTGPNGAGKTSVLRMISDGLGGDRGILPEAVNEQSEDGKGRLVLRLSNGFTIKRVSSEAAPKGYLTVVGPDGGKHGQAKLTEWVGPLSFDPLAFFTLRAERQREILLSLGSDPELAGKLDAVRKQRAQKFTDRTPWISLKRRAAAAKAPEGERPQPVDVSAEMARLGELQAQDRARGDAALRVRDARVAAAKAAEAADSARDQVEELERRLAKARTTLTERTATRDAADAAIATAREAAEGLPDPTEEMAAVSARLSAASQTDRALEPWRAFDRAQAELEEAAAAERALTAEMDALEEQEHQLIAGAGIPVEGLAFGDGGEPLLNGRPLAVASGAERIRLAVAVAIAVDPELRICLVDEANDVDLEGLKALDALAKEHGFQIWAARIGLEGPGEICVEGGVARNRDAATEVPAAAQPSLV